MEFINDYFRELIISVAVITTLSLSAVFKQHIFKRLRKLREKYHSQNFHFKGRLGKITFPSKESNVSESIHIKGYYNGIRKNDHLWIFTEINNLVWPKKNITRNEDNLCDENILESYANKDKPFKVLLVCASNFGNKKILEYLENCNKSDFPSFLGQTGFAGTSNLDTLSLNSESPLPEPKKNL